MNLHRNVNDLLPNRIFRHFPLPWRSWRLGVLARAISSLPRTRRQVFLTTHPFLVLAVESTEKQVTLMKNFLSRSRQDRQENLS
ncbi:hypothetical protein, partial [Thiohalomonas denitrificans]|uniref:hypothetical protein n=1 Tax=Thiohalomonas denitrificans TaxID=415747 RepID=UPI0026ECFD67